MKNGVRCFICGLDCVDRKTTESISLYDCNVCGRYGMYDADQDEELELQLRQMMYFYLKHKHNNDNKDVCFSESYREPDGVHDYVRYEDVMNMYPRNFSEKIDVILLNLSIEGIGRNLCHSVRIGRDYAVLPLQYVIDQEESDGSSILRRFQEWNGFLIEMGYARIENDKFLKLSANGWKRVQELQNQNKVIPQVFVAIWFDPEMNSAWENIEKAIKENNHFALRIDVKEHNNQIVPEILYEIRRSRIVVADLTGHRNGVYYEAGYAQALGKEVILTCRADEAENVHFDVVQQNTIRWKDEHDLYKRLKKRIEATLGVSDLP